MPRMSPGLPSPRAGPTLMGPAIVTRPATIVLVEDSEDLRELMALCLRGGGYRVVATEDADEAFEAVRRERPDLVVTDLLLGITSGLDLMTRIRSDLVPPQPRLIACS